MGFLYMLCMFGLVLLKETNQNLDDASFWVGVGSITLSYILETVRSIFADKKLMDIASKQEPSE